MRTHIYRVVVRKDGKVIADVSQEVSEGQPCNLRDILEKEHREALVRAFRKGAEYAFAAIGGDDGLTVSDDEARKELNLG